MRLLEGVRLGDLQLKHRVVLAPLTRMRADPQTLAPSEMAAEYYAQRATDGGLLISEATCISSESIVDSQVPGIWSDSQVRGWQRVVQGVHAKGGLISCQLWHTGRVAHSSFKDHPASDGVRVPTVSASAVPAEGSTGSTLSGERLPYSTPRPLRLDEIPRLLDDYRRAARNAERAGFDAVEIHAAHGYLLDQFLNDGVNQRDDRYGGSVENRCRLLKEVVTAVGEVFPLSRVAVRLSPHHAKSMKFYGTTDSDPDALYAAAVKMLDAFDLSYLLFSEPRWFGGLYDKDFASDPGFSMPLVNPAKFRHLYRGAVMGAGGFTPRTAEKAVDEGSYDAIAFGRWFISNPDLVERIRRGLPLNRYERKLFYAHGPQGYTDYPVFDAVPDKSVLVPQEKIGASLASSNL